MLSFFSTIKIKRLEKTCWTVVCIVKKFKKINQHVDEENNKKKSVVSRTIQVLKPNLKQQKNKESSHIYQAKQSKNHPALKC